MKLGFVYAGQGEQFVGMGQDFYNKYVSYRNTFDLACEVVQKNSQLDIKKLSFVGPEDELSCTQNTQPAMVAFALGITKMLFEHGIKPEYVCGLSLGEYSALNCAGVLNEADTMRLVTKRGQFMAQAASGLNVSMMAILGMNSEVVEECCRKAQEQFQGELVVSPVNYNCPNQIVISGHSKAVDKACVFLKEAGAKRIVPLKVSGPFHTVLMESAGDLLCKELKNIELSNMGSNVIFNCIGREKNDVEDIKELLVRQIKSPVLMEKSIRYMEAAGVDTVIEIGPGKTISKFIRKTASDIKTYSITSTDDFEAVVSNLA